MKKGKKRAVAFLVALAALNPGMNGIIYEANNAIVAKAAVQNGVQITKQPKDYIGKIGDTATFSVEAEGEGLKYQWQVNSTGTWKNTTMAGNTTAVLKPEFLATRKNYKYRCIITDNNGNEIVSNEVGFAEGTSTLTIVKQPENYIGKVGDTATFSVEAEGDGLKYQWQVNSQGTWKNTTMAGNTTAVLKPEFLETRKNYKYRCIITDKNGNELVSNAVGFTEGTSTLTIVKQPENYIGKVGDTATFSVEAEGEGLKYQWQVNSTGTWKNTAMTGNTTAVLKPEFLETRKNYKYRCIITDKNGNEIVSNAVGFAEETSKLTIVKQPENYVGKVGDTATFSVEAEGADVKYQWQVNSTGVWKNTTMAGNATAVLKPEFLEARKNYKYRCIITDKNGNELVSDEVGFILVEPNECGENVTWNFKNGILTISGTGSMTNYAPGTSPFDKLSGVKEIIVEEGVTSIGANAFSNCGAANITVLNNMCVIRGGSATIPANATLNGYSKSEAADFAVRNNVVFNSIDEAVEFNNGGNYFHIGETFQIESTGKNMHYYSTNPTYVTVDANGLVTAVSTGASNVVAYDDKGNVKTYFINVWPETDKPEVQYHTLTIPVGKRLFVGSGNNYCGTYIMNPDVVSVENNYDGGFEVYGAKEGTSDILAMLNNDAETLFVNVKNEIEPISTDVKFYGDTYYPHNTFYELTAEKTGTYIIQANAESDNFGMSLFGSADLSEDPYWSEYGSSPEIRTELKAGDTVYFYFSDSQNEEKAAYGTNFTASVKCNEYVEQAVVSGEGIRNVHTDSENTWYKLTGKANTDFLIEANNLTSYQDLYVEFFNEDKAETIRDSLLGRNVFERFSIPEGETVYIRVNAEPGSTFEYDLKITEIPYIEKEVVIGTKYTEKANDYDNTWYKITATEDAKYNLVCSNTSNQFNLDIAIFNEEKDEKIDSRYGTGCDCSFYLSAGETIYVRVNNSYRNESMNYALTVTKIPFKVTDIVLDEEYSGVANSKTSDWYVLDMEPGKKYVANIESSDTLCISILDSNKNQIDCWYEYFVNGKFKVDFEETEKIYFRMDNSYYTESVEYTFSISEMSNDKVVEVESGTSYSGKTSIDNVTWYKLTAEEDMTYFVDAESDSDINVFAFDEYREDIIDDRWDTKDGYFSIDVAGGQTIYILVKSSDGSAADYVLTVEETPYKELYPSMNRVYDGTASDYDNTWYVFTPDKTANYLLEVYNTGDSTLSFGVYDEEYEYIMGADVSDYNSFELYVNDGETVYINFQNAYHRELADYGFSISEVSNSNLEKNVSGFAALSGSGKAIYSDCHGKAAVFGLGVHGWDTTYNFCSSDINTDLFYVNGNVKAEGNMCINVKSPSFRGIVLGDLTSHMNSNLIDITYDSNSVDEVPFLYVDGTLEAYEILEINRNGKSPLDLYVGSMKSERIPHIQMYGTNLYMMDELGQNTICGLYSYPVSINSEEYGGNVYCNGDLTIYGSVGTIINGDLVVNGKLTLMEAPVTINGNLICNEIEIKSDYCRLEVNGQAYANILESQKVLNEGYYSIEYLSIATDVSGISNDLRDELNLWSDYAFIIPGMELSKESYLGPADYDGQEGIFEAYVDEWGNFVSAEEATHDELMPTVIGNVTFYPAYLDEIYPAEKTRESLYGAWDEWIGEFVTAPDAIVPSIENMREAYGLEADGRPNDDFYPTNFNDLDTTDCEYSDLVSRYGSDWINHSNVVRFSGYYAFDAIEISPDCGEYWIVLDNANFEHIQMIIDDSHARVNIIVMGENILRGSKIISKKFAETDTLNYNDNLNIYVYSPSPYELPLDYVDGTLIMDNFAVISANFMSPYLSLSDYALGVNQYNYVDEFGNVYEVRPTLIGNGIFRDVYLQNNTVVVSVN